MDISKDKPVERADIERVFSLINFMEQVVPKEYKDFCLCLLDPLVTVKYMTIDEFEQGLQVDFEKVLQKWYNQFFRDCFWGIIIVLGTLGLWFYSFSQIYINWYYVEDKIPIVISGYTLYLIYYSLRTLRKMFAGKYHLVACMEKAASCEEIGKWYDEQQKETFYNYLTRIFITGAIALYIFYLALVNNDYLDKPILYLSPLLVLVSLCLFMVIVRLHNTGIKYNQRIDKLKKEVEKYKEWIMVYNGIIKSMCRKMDVSKLKRNARMRVAKESPIIVIGLALIMCVVLLVKNGPILEMKWNAFKEKVTNAFIQQTEEKDGENDIVIKIEMEELNGLLNIEDMQPDKDISETESNGLITNEYKEELEMNSEKEAIISNEKFYVDETVPISSMGCDITPDGYFLYIDVEKSKKFYGYDTSKGNLYIRMDYLNTENTFVYATSINMNECIGEEFFNANLVIDLQKTEDIAVDEINRMTVRVYYVWEPYDEEEIVVGPSEEFALKSYDNFQYFEYKVYISQYNKATAEGDVKTEDTDTNTQVDVDYNKQIAAEIIKSELGFGAFGNFDVLDEAGELKRAMVFVLEPFEEGAVPHPVVGKLYANIDFMNKKGKFVLGNRECINDNPGQEQILLLYIGDIYNQLHCTKDDISTYQVYYSWECEGREVFGPRLEVKLKSWDCYTNYNQYLK